MRNPKAKKEEPRMNKLTWQCIGLPPPHSHMQPDHPLLLQELCNVIENL
jgi:hypothetical protein